MERTEKHLFRSQDLIVFQFVTKLNVVFHQMRSQGCSSTNLNYQQQNLNSGFDRRYTKTGCTALTVFELNHITY